ncbi:MAG: carbonic anhydrase family protein [Chloroflexi bacterium]|nr:carbonic anhydrase family protein [Chloroflexota bacterium]
MNIDSKWASRGGGLVIGALLLGIYLLVAVGCSSGSADASASSQSSRSESKILRALSASDTTSSRESASHETASDAGHSTSADSESSHETAADGQAAVVSHETTSDTVSISNPVHSTASETSDHADTATESHATTDVGGDSAETTEEAHASGGEIHWGYTGSNGQNYWSDQSADYTSCVDGSAQSPIDIKDARLADLEDLEFHYSPSMMTVVNNGHTIQANYGSESGESSWMVLNGNEYELLQFHYHRPSEHTINGHQAAMEMHLVHKDAEGKLAVVGVLLEPGAHNTSLDPIWDVLPDHAGDEVTVDGLFDVNKVLPQDRRTFRYPGSLTTPPCSEGVSWLLMKTPVSLSQAQVDEFKEHYFFNARYTQPLNGREIFEDISVGD